MPYDRCTSDHRFGWAAYGVLQVRADEIEATEVTRSPLDQRERTLRAQLQGLDAKAGNLMAVLEEEGTEGLALVEDRLAVIERQRATFTSELRRVREQLRGARRSRIDFERVRSALGNMRLLHEVATPEERGELVRLLFKTLRFQGKGLPLEPEVIDHRAAVFEAGAGSIFQAARLK